MDTSLKVQPNEIIIDNATAISINSHTVRKSNLLILKCIESACAIRDKTVTLVCDNEAATVELHQVATDPFAVTDPLQTDYDILLEIQAEVNMSSSTFLIKWIKGHQEDTASYDALNFLAKLNIDCNTCTKAYLWNHSGELPQPPTIYPAEIWVSCGVGTQLLLT